MPTGVFTALLVALFTFLLLPLSGAFLVRKRWRSFRALVRKAAQLPVFDGKALPAEAQVLAFVGNVEAIQGNNRLWVRVDGTSVQVSLDKHTIWTLLEESINLNTDYSPQSPVVSRWTQVGALAQGAPVFIAGTLKFEGGRLCLEDWAGGPPFVVFFDGDEASLFPRLLWTGRQKNEFWNLYTPISCLIGFAIISIMAFTYYRETHSVAWSVIIASLSTLPFIVLLPPGILGFFVYRSLWRKGRRIRRMRDVVVLADLCSKEHIDSPYLRLMPELPGDYQAFIKKAANRALRTETFSVLIFTVSLVLNWYLSLQLMAILAAMH